MNKVFLLTLWFGFAVGPLRAQTPRPPATPPPTTTGGTLERLLLAGRPVVNQRLTLDEAVAIARRESPVVRGAVAEVEAAVAQLAAARAETRPMVSANTFVSGGSIANIVESPQLPVARMIMGLPRGAYADQNLMVMFPLYTAGRLQALVRQAAAQQGASEANLRAQGDELALLTRVAYRDVLLRQALVEVARTRLRENEERLRVDRARLEQQQIPAYYVSRDQAEVAASQQAVTNAQRDALIAVSQLKTVLGVSLASRLELSADALDHQPSKDLLAHLTAGTTATAVDPSLPADLVALLRRAEQQRPELQTARQRIAAARAVSAAIQGGYRPQVNLFAMGDVVKMGGERASGGVTYGLAASIPLYTGGGERARVQGADAQRRQQEQEQERVALQIAQEVNAGYLTLLAAEQNIQTARTALSAAQDEYRAARARYDAGRSVLVEALDALASRGRAEVNVVQASYEYNVAGDRLRRAIGALDVAAAASQVPQR